jgi:hypothetical protein
VKPIIRAAARSAPALATAALAAAGLYATGTPAGAATAAPDTGLPICLVNGSQFCLDGQGQGNQMELNFPAISNFSTSFCGEINGQSVQAWQNSNNLWVHALSNGKVTLDNNSTNGCSNNADKWITVNAATHWQNVATGRLLWSPSDNGGALIQNSNAGGGWITWRR